MSEEIASGFLGNLYSFYPKGIHGSAEQIEEYAEKSMLPILNSEDVESFFNDDPTDDVSCELPAEMTNTENEIVEKELKEQMDKMEIEYGSLKSREQQERQHSNKFKSFLKDHNCDVNFENYDERKLSYWLRRFYFSKL